MKRGDFHRLSDE
ncbi:Protein of unknown function [Lactobacillus helveticus CIRM-BIA 953]|uniref:Uncharacterized protein n=1 Tax=Lactobacillus helveticus CIRM-BIA 953 TaxID=1226335 RepID=U4QN12_LACHE|nr:Protein of unknown function [Lactobacillus helveticus CIRM-BIA 953]